MDQEYFFSTFNVRHADLDLSIKPPRSCERFIKHIGSISSCEYNNFVLPAALREAVHLDQQLIQRIFSFIVAAREATPTSLPPDRIDLVDEDHAGLVLPSFLE